MEPTLAGGGNLRFVLFENCRPIAKVVCLVRIGDGLVSIQLTPHSSMVAVIVNGLSFCVVIARTR